MYRPIYTTLPLVLWEMYVNYIYIYIQYNEDARFLFAQWKFGGRAGHQKKELKQYETTGK